LSEQRSQVSMQSGWNLWTQGSILTRMPGGMSSLHTQHSSLSPEAAAAAASRVAALTDTVSRLRSEVTALQASPREAEEGESARVRELPAEAATHKSAAAAAAAQVRLRGRPRATSAPPSTPPFLPPLQVRRLQTEVTRLTRELGAAAARQSKILAEAGVEYKTIDPS
jgi:hypothetical protein